MHLFVIFLATYFDRVVENAFGCALGSAIAIIISILIYQRGNRTLQQAADNQRLADEALQTADELNQMRAFKVLLERSIRTSELWSEGIKKFIPELKAHPVIFPLLTMTSIANLERIINTITIEKTGRTYMKHFPGQNSAGEFISILESVDYLYAEFSQLYKMIKMASLNHQDRLNKVSDKFDIADELILKNLEHMEKINLNNDIQKIKTNFAEKRGDLSDIHAVNSLYFVPMQQFMRRILESGYMDEFVKNYTYAISKGIEFYTYVGNGYKRFYGEMVEIENKINTNIEELKVRADNILRSNLAQF